MYDTYGGLLIDGREMVLAHREALSEKCSHPGCDRTWFTLRRGAKWCLTHVPQWGAK